MSPWTAKRGEFGISRRPSLITGPPKIRDFCSTRLYPNPDLIQRVTAERHLPALCDFREFAVDMRRITHR